jgi:hypothetical protein
MNSMALQAQPSLTQLNRLIKKVPSYPISVSDLLHLAKASKQPKEVLDFYKTFNRDQVFENPDDLQGRSEQVEVMRQEEKEMPKEWEVAPEEY